MIKRLCYKIMNLARNYESDMHSYPVVVEESPIDMEGLKFRVMPAQGGTVVQINHYDRKADRNTTITHVIPDGENVAERIGQIVSMELLRC